MSHCKFIDSFDFFISPLATISNKPKSPPYSPIKGISFLDFYVKLDESKIGAEKDMVPVQAKENDPRVTKVGKLLRNTAMDELPQLVNIFKGDMSFVGPRAFRPREIELHGNPGDKE